MWSKKYFLLLILLSSTLGSKIIEEQKFLVDYFLYKNVKHICLISCENDNWVRKLSLIAFKYSIFVSGAKVTNSTDVRQLDKCFEQKYTPTGIVIILINLKCRKFGDIAIYASQNKWFDDSHKWIILDVDSEAIEPNQTTETNAFQSNQGNKESLSNNNSQIEHSTDFEDAFKLENVLKDLNISVDADILFVKSTRNQMDLYNVYNYGKELGASLIIEKMEYFDPSKALEKYKYYRRWDFQQLHIRMAVVTRKPEVFNPETFTDNIPPAPDIPNVVRSPAMTLHVIAKIHNIKYKYNLMETWVTDVRDGNKKVALNSVYYKQSDLITALRFLQEITEFAEVISPHIFSMETRYYYRIPTEGPGKLENKFLTPLSTATWLCILGIMPLCVLIIFQSSRFERRPSPAQFAIFSVAAAFCQQFFEDNNDDRIKRNSSARKLTVFVTGLFCVLIYNYYTSSVVSWLLNGPPPSINSLEELLESPLELIYEDVGYTHSWLKVPSFFYNKRNAAIENKFKKKVLEKRSEDDLSFFKSLQEGIDLVKAGGYAYHAEVNSANEEISKKFSQIELCELGALKSMEETMLFAAVQRRSPYKEFFKWSLMRLKERGIIECIKLRNTVKPFRCEGSSPRALALGGAAPAFLLLAIGYITAGVLLVCERLHVKYKANNTYSTSNKFRKLKKTNPKRINFTE